MHPHTLITTDARQTFELGAMIGTHLDSGTLIKLTGDLGSGKTCFVQGLAQGLDVPEEYDITSPTYTLVHEYPGRLPLLHIDLYRIHDEMDAEAIGLYEIMQQENVVAVEWADRLSKSFWPDMPTLDMIFQTLKDDRRQIKLFGYGLKISNLIRRVGT